MSPALPPRERNSNLFEVLTMFLTLVEHLQPWFSLSCNITIPPHWLKRYKKLLMLMMLILMLMLKKYTSLPWLKTLHWVPFFFGSVKIEHCLLKLLKCWQSEKRLSYFPIWFSHPPHISEEKVKSDKNLTNLYSSFINNVLIILNLLFWV